MAMDKINGNPLPRPGYLDQARPSERPMGGTSADAKATSDLLGGGSGAGALPTAGGDTAQISQTAHRLMALRQAVDTGRAALELLPEVREDKVALARERLQSGHYESREVREAAAGNIAGVFGALDRL